MGWAKLLEVGSLDAATSRRAAEAISRNASVQAKLIEDILDVSRIVTGKVRLDVRRVDLAQAVLTAVENARPAADAKRVRLEADVVASGDAVPADVDRLQQILANLLSNSVKFTPAGGVVRVCARAEGGEAEIVVADSGEGIDPDFLPHVFERFRQADGSTARRHGGLGLGLAIVRHLVELHGGSVRVESPGVGLGTTFVVRLPLGAHAADAAGDRAPDDLAPRGTDLGGTRVLVVDDEPDAREVTSCVLAAAGAEVRTASSAAEAILMLSAWLPDVLVADIGMPTEDGYALMRRVRELPAEKGGAVPALAVTAYARAQDCELAFEVGFHDHVAKPVPPRALVSAVARLRAAARRDA
jgi:CheY-like chemotaxis protein